MKVSQTETLKGFSLGDVIQRPFTGDQMMVVRGEAPKGAIVEKHSHPHEQMLYVISGSLRFQLEEEEQVLGPGEIVHIPSGKEHSLVFLEDSLILDVFSPIREDMLKKLEQQQ
ncbi:cupin domain-containing protein [Ammoniphilus resinae]|uniref:Quercetin dioxygenase-like cupin family protein n=1 Tax=Ammoniphilus resinae TaxID=861532 RepID=A0ABS4GL51_9BACL|nr:cupin domain-containing protein [Ammoniphilus resinae]MBP1930995.1 quercetin dioxygenase-like cupin family protein [Ammoniphilus resinae]